METALPSWQALLTGSIEFTGVMQAGGLRALGMDRVVFNLCGGKADWTSALRFPRQ